MSDRFTKEIARQVKLYGRRKARRNLKTYLMSNRTDMVKEKDIKPDLDSYMSRAITMIKSGAC
ncbi:MAG: hypothetical protein K9L57_12365 [Spirochaetaceae bacterium]|nr:hypothetical protein [Spirochaetaceae bacterium]